MSESNVLLVGPSGSGKSTSLRHLDPNRTVIINTERKRLPFPNASEFEKQVFVEDYRQFEGYLDKAGESDADIIVIESLTSLVEMLYIEAKRRYGKTYDLWDWYGDEIKRVLDKCKSFRQDVVFISIDQTDMTADGEPIKFAKVQGNKMGKGAIEKEFVIVLWSVAVNHDNEIRYCFMTNTDGSNKAKSPMGMFEDRFIGNDMRQVIERISEYYEQ